MALAGAVLMVFYTNCSGQFKAETMTDLSSQSSAASCRLKNGMNPVDPTSTAKVVELINQLEKPVTIPCLISFLPKPLKIYAVDNKASAQPSAGPQSPRIFIFNQNLILSVVPEGSGKDAVELSDVVGIYRSVKAEIGFPVMGDILTSEPYDRVLSTSGGSSCRGCHNNEVKNSSITYATAYTTDLILPDPKKQIFQKDLYQNAISCKTADDRCNMLREIFINGAAVDSPFTAAPLNGVPIIGL